MLKLERMKFVSYCMSVMNMTGVCELTGLRMARSCNFNINTLQRPFVGGNIYRAS
jgi:hypothetical protein